jgi:hypothetical protein
MVCQILWFAIGHLLLESLGGACIHFHRAAIQDVRGHDNVLSGARDFTEDLIISAAVDKRSSITRRERRVDSGDFHDGNGPVDPAFR